MSKSICTVVLFDGSSNVGYKIAMQHIDGSEATLTVLAVITKAGANYIPSPLLNKMFEINGLRATEATKENGNEL